MTEPSAGPEDLHRRRLFFGICLALIPTGASFALVSNILVPLKQQFILTNDQVGLIGGAALWGMAISLLVMGPLLEGFGLKNGARLAFLGHLAGITLMISAASRAGDPSAFWLLLVGAATLAAGNGMIEVTGNPLVTRCASSTRPADPTTSSSSRIPLPRKRGYCWSGLCPGAKIAPLSSPLLITENDVYEIAVPALSPGRYPFVCLPHFGSRMLGTLEVVP